MRRADRLFQIIQIMRRARAPITADAIAGGGFTVIANTTSIGMHPNENETPVDPSVFGPGTVAFDAVYNPRETRMLREARERGAEIADGIAPNLAAQGCQ